MPEKIFTYNGRGQVWVAGVGGHAHGHDGGHMALTSRSYDDRDIDRAVSEIQRTEDEGKPNVGC